MPSTSVDGCSIYYKDIGRGVPVVISQGGRNGLEVAMPLAEKLAQTCRVIVWDRSNLGRSDFAFKGASEIDMWADQLYGLLKVLGAKPAFLVAASSGARLSLRMALRYPDAVRGLFLWLLTGGPVADILAQMYYGEPADLAGREGMSAVAATPYWSERIRANPANRERLLAQDPGEFVAIMRRWAVTVRADDLLVGVTEDDLRRITARTRIVAPGDSSHLRERMERAAEVMPNADLLDPPLFGEEWLAIRAKALGTGYESISHLGELIEKFVTENT